MSDERFRLCGRVEVVDDFFAAQISVHVVYRLIELPEFLPLPWHWRDLDDCDCADDCFCCCCRRVDDFWIDDRRALREYLAYLGELCRESLDHLDALAYRDCHAVVAVEVGASVRA